MNKSLATVPGLVSKSGWANLKKSIRLKIISFTERIVTIFVLKNRLYIVETEKAVVIGFKPLV